MGRFPRHCSATLVVSDSGNETGAASRAHVWPDVVSLAAHSALTSAHIPHQVRYSNFCAVQDEEAPGSRASRWQRRGVAARSDVGAMWVTARRRACQIGSEGLIMPDTRLSPPAALHRGWSG